MLSPVLWEQNPDPRGSANKIAESGSSHRQMIPASPSRPQKKSVSMNLLENMTVLLTERIPCHPTPLKATA